MNDNLTENKVVFQGVFLVKLFAASDFSTMNGVKLANSVFLVFWPVMSTQGNSSSARSCLDVADLQKLFKLPSIKYFDETLGHLLVMDVFGLSQIYIAEVLQYYPKLRDLYNEPPFHTILVHMTLWMASGLNASLISFANLTLCENVDKVVKSLPTVIGPILSNSLLKAYNDHDQEDQDVPKLMFGLKYPLALNFIYCGKGTSFERASILETLFSKVDTPVWICLGISLMVVTLMCSIEPIPNSKHFWGNPLPFMTTVSVLLTSGPSGKIRKNSVSFVLWMFACLIFVTYYSGSLTSTVISPSREVRLREMDQILEHNFSFIFEEQNFPVDLAIDAVEFSFDNSSDSDVKLLGSLKSALRKPSEEDFLEALVSGEKLAAFTAWPSAIFAANLGNKFISKNDIKMTRCFIGEELLHQIDYHYGFTGFDNEKLARVAVAMEESGFYALWWHEFFGLATSTRVQGRSRVVNPAKLQDDKEQVRPLQLEGKLMDVFLLWVKCLGVAVLAFILELTKLKIGSFGFQL